MIKFRSRVATEEDLLNWNPYAEAAQLPEAPENIQLYSYGELLEEFQDLRPVVIDSIAREGETVNVISLAKVGKSWFAYLLAITVATGRQWLGRFSTAKGNVLFVDNELHEESLSFRIDKVASAMGVNRRELDGKLGIVPMRGLGHDIYAVSRWIRNRFEPGTFKLIILDAKYRFMTGPENDNAAERDFYNAVDALAKETRAAIVLIHHSTKGDQSSKRVTDVGAGGGAQSRAADTHLVLREHEDPNAVVLDAAVRSFKPIEPVVLRWSFPLWQVDETLSPDKLKCVSGPEAAQQKRDSKADKAVYEALEEKSLALRQLRDATGMGQPRVAKAVKRLIKAGKVESAGEVEHGGNKCELFQLSLSSRKADVPDNDSF